MIALAGDDQALLQRWSDMLLRLGRPATVLPLASLLKPGLTAPTVCLYDLGPRGGGDLAGLAGILTVCPDTRFIALTAHPQAREGLRLLRAGARGYCNRLASAAVADALLATVESGKVWAGKQVIDYLVNEAIAAATPEPSSRPALFRVLTKRETQIAEQVAAGLPNKAIAAENGITEPTVKAHLNKIFRKTGVRNRVQLALALTQATEEPRRLSTG